MKTDTIASASTILFNPRFGKKKRQICVICSSSLLNMVTLNAESLGQRERRVPIGWWRIAVLDGCFHASPVGASSCAQRQRSPGTRTMWVSAHRSSSAPRQHLCGVEYEELADLLTPQTHCKCGIIRLLRPVSTARERRSGIGTAWAEREPSDLAAGSARVAARGAWERSNIQPILELHSRQFNEEEKIPPHK